MTPTDVWEWDAETGEVVALDVSDTRNGEAVPVDFTDEPVGLLGAAAPDMARALLAFLPENGHTLECGNVTGDEAQCSDECRNGRAALRKAGVIP